MAYQCDLQNEVMCAPWTRGSVTLFTCAVYHNSTTNNLIFGTDYKGKDNISTGLFIEKLYENEIPANENVVEEEIILSDGPSSEFKNEYMCLLNKKLSSVYQKKFFMEILSNLSW